MGFLDKEMLFLDDADHDDTPAVLDIGYAFNPGSGAQLRGFISCADGDAAGTTALVIKTGATSATAADTTVATLAMTHTQMNAGFNFNIPITGLLRYVTMSLTSISAGGGITAGLVLDVQTA